MHQYTAPGWARAIYDVSGKLTEDFGGGPDFDPSRHAFYYVRALEIPTPRWSTCDPADRGGDAPGDLPTSIRERAYSSPIWYTP